MIACNKISAVAIIVGYFICISIVPGTESLVLTPQKTPPIITNRQHDGKKAIIIGINVVSALLLTAPILIQPSIAVESSNNNAADAITGPLETAIIQMSDAAYPVLSSLKDMSSLSNKLVKLGDKIPAAKATSALDKGIDSFLAIPDEKVANFASTLQSSYEGVSGESCTASISIPISSIEQWTSSAAVQALDSTKIQSLQDKFKSANQAVPRTTTASGYSNICLPATQQQLEKLWIGQTELTLNVPRPEARAFVSSASTALKSVPSSEFIRVFPEAKKAFTTNVDKRTSMKFESNAKALEKAIQSDERFVQRGLKI